MANKNQFLEGLEEDDGTNDTKKPNQFLEGLEEKEDIKKPNQFLEGLDGDGDKEAKKPNPFLIDVKNEKLNAQVEVIRNRIEKFDFMEFLMTPTGRYYAELGEKLDSNYVLEKLGVPETIPLAPEIKYPPHVLKMIEVSGGDINNIKDRMAAAVVLDTFAAKGFSAIGKSLAPKAFRKAASNLSKLSDEALDITNQELKKLEGTGQYIEKGLQIADDPLINLPQDNIARYSMSPTEDIIGGIKYEGVGRNAPFTQVKVANESDKINALMSRADIVNNPEKIISKGEQVGDLIPPPGQKDFSDVSVFARGYFSYIRSPQDYAPKVYGLIGELETRQNQIRSALFSKMEKFAHMEGTPKAKMVGAVADGQDNAQEILNSGLLGEDGLRAVEAWRSVAEEAADVLKLPKEKRIANYLTHVWDDLKDKDYPLPEELKQWVTENKKFLKARTGSREYNLDFVRASKIYIDWVSKNVAKKEFTKPLLNAVEEIRSMDKIRGNMAHTYFLNYFGELNKSGALKDLAKLSGEVKKSFASGTIAWNLPTALLNLTQGPIFGAAKIGYIPFTKGFAKLAVRSKDTTKILKESGIIDNLSLDELKKTTGIWDKILSKVPGGKAIVKHQFAFMEASELINKGSVYLGGYDHIINQMKYVKRVGTKKAKGTINWLERRGVDISNSAEAEAHKYARKATMDTQIDFSRAGQNLISMSPQTSSAWMYMSFPVKMGEFILKNVGATLKYFGKAIKLNPIETGKGFLQASQMPEVRTTVRMALTGAVLQATADKAGVNFDQIIGYKNFMPQMAPLWNAAFKMAPAIRGLFEKDPRAAQNVARSFFTLTGLPINAPAWKLASIIEVINDNKDNKSGEWIIRSRRTGKPTYKVDPMLYLLGKVTRIAEPKEEEEYYQYLHDISKESRILRNMNNAITINMNNKDKEKAKELKKEARIRRRKFNLRKKLREQELR